MFRLGLGLLSKVSLVTIFSFWKSIVKTHLAEDLNLVLFNLSSFSDCRTYYSGHRYYHFSGRRSCRLWADQARPGPQEHWDLQERFRKLGLALPCLRWAHQGPQSGLQWEAMDIVGPLHPEQWGRQGDDPSWVYEVFQGGEGSGDHHALSGRQHALLFLHASK